MTQDKLLTMGLDEIDNFLNSAEGDFASFGDTIIFDDDKLNQMSTDDYAVELNVLDSTKDESDDFIVNPFTEEKSTDKPLTKVELDDLFSDIIEDVNAKEVKKEDKSNKTRKATAFKPVDDIEIELDGEPKKARKATAFKPVDDIEIELDEKEPKKTRKATAFKPVDDIEIDLEVEEAKKARKATEFKLVEDIEIELPVEEVTEVEADTKSKKQSKATKDVEVEDKPKKTRKSTKKKVEKVEVIEEQAVQAEQILTEEDVQDIRTVIRDVIYKEVRSAFKDAIKNVANDLLGK